MLSIIVPTYNEENSILDLLIHLSDAIGPSDELLVVDGGSSDKTIGIVEENGFTCLKSPRKGRAAQMNFGAKKSTGEVLYFVHADTFPPATFRYDIKEALTQGYESGCYRYRFDRNHPLLKINAYCTRFDRLMCRGGDQTLFIKRDLFDELGGFREDFMIMEDYDLIQKIQSRAGFRIIPKNATVSARKYDNNGYFRVNFANLVIFMMYFAGLSQETMVHAYKNLIIHPKFD
ncbi:TIGR04283 family arsenosugar biosynthesis glycosyltransferase [Gracilimonas sediminicola]|uniref:TIGR04283 family arsenosugar biosynthesis glycosyltransferase n=1 Tax=Gracilimonas sediminicola TaxID=2952158 RepID=A0A9X2L458_9BACT|nr:TIGR04283 family arsenosugar biosynthesis glycosyltransferase [Gracilimonas sediminicola]MCP9291935.1 TIGR04283 family arsenosugar biosynthesis glycosyltransferase [Gracilimonas sediminicola]